MMLHVSMKEFVGQCSRKELLRVIELAKERLNDMEEVRANGLTANEMEVATRSRLEAVRMVRQRTGVELKQCYDMVRAYNG